MRNNLKYIHKVPKLDSAISHRQILSNLIKFNAKVQRFMNF
jgi:hypothetical protein